MILRRAQPSESREVRDWIEARHYTHSAPPGYVVALEFIEGRERIGAMLLGRPAARSLDPDEWLELTRMFFLDGTERFVESRALSMMRRFVRVWLPRTRGLLAYSDPSVGHDGTVYRADNWAQWGRTRNGWVGWATRPGRRAVAPSRKLRWIRTP